jgi:hypothetical protein
MTETTTSKTPFPERMHNQSIDSHARRAVNALSDLIERAAILRDRLQAFDRAGPEMAGTLAEMALKAGIHLSALEVLRETREWDEAERNGS